MKFSKANAKFLFITFDESCDKTCSKIGKTCFPLVAWQKSIKNDEWKIQKQFEKYEKYRKNIRFPQWCNLTLVPQFWATKVWLQASKISKICLFGHPTGRATSWKANFEICSRYSLIKWYQFLSIWHSMRNTI